MYMYFFFSTQNESSDTCCTCILISETKFGGWDGSASQSLAQCLYGADTLCWNLTANDRSSAPSLVWPLPLHPLCSHSVRYRISWTPNANNSLLVFLSIKKKKKISLRVSLEKLLCLLNPPSLQVSLKVGRGGNETKQKRKRLHLHKRTPTHTVTHTHTHAHIHTLKTNTPRLHPCCPPTVTTLGGLVSVWGGCGGTRGRDVGAFNPGGVCCLRGHWPDTSQIRLGCRARPLSLLVM